MKKLKVLSRANLKGIVAGNVPAANYCITHGDCGSGSVCVFQFNSGDIPIGICCTSADLHGHGNPFCTNVAS